MRSGAGEAGIQPATSWPLLIEFIDYSRMLGAWCEPPGAFRPSRSARIFSAVSGERPYPPCGIVAGRFERK
jgi:hypothetical protein